MMYVRRYYQKQEEADERLFFFACMQNHGFSLLRLLRHNDNDLLTCRDIYGRFGLHVAASYNHTSIIEILIKAKADIHGLDTQGYNALDHAIMNQCDDVVGQLVEYGLRPRSSASNENE